MAEFSKATKKRKPNIPLEIPVREPRALTPEELSVSFQRTVSKAAKNALKNKFSKCLVAIERGLDFKDLGKEVKEIFEKRDWMDLASAREGEVNMTLVAEFYSLVATHNAVEDGELASVNLRTREVPFTPHIINAIYGIEDVPDHEDYYSVWNLDEPVDFDHMVSLAQHELDPNARWIENRFYYGRCIRDMRAIKRFISSTLYPTKHLTSFGREDLCIAWAMVNDIPVDIGKVMYRRAKEFVKTAKPGSHMPFPCFISSLCRRMGVPELPNDLMIMADEELIGPSLPALPAGNRFYESQPPPTSACSTSFSAYIGSTIIKSSTSTSSTTITYDMFQSLSLDVSRAHANMAIYAERNRQWNEDLRQGIRGLYEMNIVSNPAYADMDFPHCQSEPYSLPETIPPMPPPSSFQPMSQAFGSQSSGSGTFSTGTTTSAMSSLGGFASYVDTTTSWGQAFTDVTTGMSTMGFDSSTGMSTPFFEPIQDPVSSQSMPSSGHIIIEDEEE